MIDNRSINPVRITMKKIQLLLSASVLVSVLASCATTTKTVEAGSGSGGGTVSTDSGQAAPKNDTVGALIADGTKLLKEGRSTDAKAKFVAALDKDAGSVDAKVGLAQAELNLGDFAGAKAILTDLQQSQPDSRQVVLLLGLLAKEQGDFEGGIALYEKEIAKQKEAKQAPDPVLLNNLITMYRLSKNYEEAIKVCTTLLSRDPKNADALKNLSLVYFDQGKFDLAETIAINCLKLNPNDAALYNNQGMIRVKKKRWPEAMSFFYKAIEVDSNNLAAHLNIASIALRYRDYANAAKHFAEAMKLEPKHPEANLGYGLALSGVSGGLNPDDQAKKAPDAVTQLQRALEIDPSASEAIGEIAMINKLQLSNTIEAKAWCDKYRDAKSGKFDDKDVMKKECNNIDTELKSKDAANRAMEQMRAAEKEEAEKEAAEKAKNPPPPPATPAAPAAPATPASASPAPADAASSDAGPQ